MKHLLIGITAAIIIAAAVGQARAQVPWPQQAQIGGYPLNAATPEDAYRQGLINRWELERLEGPMPQALQGPSVNGERGDSDGGNRQ